MVPLPIMTTPFPPKSLLRNTNSVSWNPVPRKCFSLILVLRTGASAVRLLFIYIFLEDWVKRNPPGMWISPGASSPWISLSLLLGTMCSMKLDFESLQPARNIKYQRDHVKLSFNVTGRSLFLFNFLFIMTSCKSI